MDRYGPRQIQPRLKVSNIIMESQPVSSASVGKTLDVLITRSGANSYAMGRMILVNAYK